MMIEQRNYWMEICAEEFEAPALGERLIADLVIIGGGYTGCAAALEAAKLGLNVILLEAKFCGYGGSGRNVGLVNAGLWLPPDKVKETMGGAPGEKLVDALSKAPNLVFELIDENKIQCDAKRNGTIHCAHNEKGLSDLKLRHAQWQERNAPVSLLDQKQVVKITGTKSYHGGLIDHRAGIIQPLGYLRGLARGAKAKGAKIFENSPVVRVEHGKGSWSVSTPNGEVVAKTVLFAQNAYAEKGFGMTASKTAIVNYFQAVTHSLPDDIWAAILPQDQGCWDTAPIMTSVRKAHNNRFVIGAMGQPAGFGRYIHLSWAEKKMAKLFPALKTAGFESYWSGKISMSSNYIPKIMRLDSNLYSIFGYSGRGIGPGTYFGTQFARYLLSNSKQTLPVDITHSYRDRSQMIKTLVFEMGARISHL